MNATFIDDILDGLSRWGEVIRVVITRTHGSTPRDAGASMIVAIDDFLGTIGGGKLEYLALAEARQMLQNPDKPRRLTKNFVLGTELRQCCGGVAWLLLERFEVDQMVNLENFRETLQPDSLVMRPTLDQGFFQNSATTLSHLQNAPALIAGAQEMMLEGSTASPLLINHDESDEEWFLEPAAKELTPLYIYGAGHVGRALVHVLKNTPFEIRWVETDEGRFPQKTRPAVKKIISPVQADYAATITEKDAFHVVLTYSHEADLDICRAVLKHAQGQYLGLIASDTKKARFINRLKKDGVSEEDFKIFRCPIGLMSFKHKDPSIVAISIAAQLIAEYEQGESEMLAGSAGDLYDL